MRMHVCVCVFSVIIALGKKLFLSLFVCILMHMQVEQLGTVVGCSESCLGSESRGCFRVDDPLPCVN